MGQEGAADASADVRQAAAAGLVLASVIVANLAGVWSVDHLPTHDGPQHIFSLHAASRLADPEAGYDRFLRAGLPITNHGFAALYAPFDLWLPWRTATRVALSGMLLLWCAGGVALARALHPRRLWLGALLAGLGFQWSLYMGLFSYYVATALGLGVLAYGVAARHWGMRQRAVLGSLLFLQALLHVFPAIATGGLLLSLGLARATRSERPGELLRCAAMGLPAGLVALVLLAAAPGQSDLAQAGASAAYAPEWPGLWILAKCFAAGPAWRAWPPLLLGLTSAILGWRGWRSRDAQDRGLLTGGGALLAAAVVLPLDAPGWDFFSVRFLPLGAACLLLTLPLERIRAPGAAVSAAALAVLAIASALWALDYNRTLAARSAPALAGLEADLRRTGPRLALVMDPLLGRPLEDRAALVPYAAPLLNLGQLYATEQGGFPAYTFAISPVTHHVLVRDDAARAFPPVPDRNFPVLLAREGGAADTPLRRRLLTYAAAYGAAFEDVILWGHPSDAELLLARGFVADWREGGLLLAHFEGCPLALSLDSAGALDEDDLDGPIEVELGWLPLSEPARRFRAERDPAAGVGPGSRRIPLPGAPCGPVWIRARTAGGATCRGVDAEGRLLVPEVRATPELICTLEPGTGVAARAPRPGR
jgi:hypothetical protein